VRLTVEQGSVVTEDVDAARAMLAQADSARRRVRLRGRRFALFLAVVALFWAGIVVASRAAHGWSAVPFAVLLVAVILVGQRLDPRQQVAPSGARGAVLRSTAWTIVTYLLADLVVLPGLPTDASWGWWILAGVVVGAEPAVEAVVFAVRDRT
jgi:hypothetical protein